MKSSAVLLQTLLLAKKRLRELKTGKDISRAGGAFGDLQNDTELTADKVIGQYLAEQFRKVFPGACISVEGLPDKDTDDPSHTWVTVDPLDGSLNYLHAGGMTGFPVTAVVTVLNKKAGATFADITDVAVLDLRGTLRDSWTATWRSKESRYSTRLRSGKSYHAFGSTMDVGTLDLGRMNVIGEMYYPENREKLFRAFAGEKGWLRSPGSAAYEMASVASGQAVAFVCDRQKQHELGAGYALVKGSGGVAVDWDGKDLGTRTYDFKTQTPCILAANMRIAEQLLERLNR
ncbi:MAG: inositol monophosphatase family protein [Patescibacteria group bacterium]|jgi:myo-inositol-1(or 4)-monophosphatase